MKRWIVGGIAGVAAVALATGGYAMTTGTSPGPELDLVSNDRYDGPRLRAVGLTADQRLVGFAVQKPDEVRGIGKIAGLQGDTRLVGIDYRVQDGKLYGVGEAGGVYTLSASNAKAAKVSQLTVALSGKSFGVDFNPAADRLRIVSDTGQNLRHNVNAGGTTAADTALTYPPATATVSGVTAVAYTNNDLDADTGTTLFDIDTTLDQVALQAPANSGQLSPIGKLRSDAAGDAGFDIYSQLRSGTAADAAGFATLLVDGRTTLYKISLITGRADKLGAFPRGSQVTDLALPLAQ
jgi:hypothetical protein